MRRERIIGPRSSTTRYSGWTLNLIGPGVLALFALLLADADLQAGTQIITEKSIAVLPFADRSAGVENTRFLADGIHDELLITLSNVRGLRVIARTSVNRYRDTTSTTQQIAGDLGVTHLVEGIVQQSGDRVRLSVQLINALTAEKLWSETFDGEVTTGNIFTFQGEVARTIADALELTFPPEVNASLARAPTDNLDAFRALLVAQQFENQDGFESLQRAAEYARNATDLDPAYAQAHLALARVLIKSAASGALFGEPVNNEIATAIDAAMELRPRWGSAWAVLGTHRELSGQPGSDEAFEMALSMNPGNFDTLYAYGDALRRSGRPEPALPLLKQASARDPLAPEVLFSLGATHLGLEEYKEARGAFSRILEIDPSSPLGYGTMGKSFVQEGLLDKALYWLGKAAPVDLQDYESAGWMVFLNDSLEDYVAADEWSSWLDGRITKQSFPIAMQARHHYLTGKFELALQLSNLALRLDLSGNPGSDAVFMRIKRDEALANGNPAVGVRVFEEHHPELFQSEPVIVAGNAMQAVDLAQLLTLAGRRAQALALLEATIRYYDEPWSTSGENRFWLVPVKAEALAVMGDEPGALEELRRIVETGWKLDWRWETELNFNFNGVRETPEFQAIVSDLTARVAEQRNRAQAMADNGEIPPPPVNGSE